MFTTHCGKSKNFGQIALNSPLSGQKTQSFFGQIALNSSLSGLDNLDLNHNHDLDLNHDLDQCEEKM